MDTVTYAVVVFKITAIIVYERERLFLGSLMEPRTRQHTRVCSKKNTAIQNKTACSKQLTESHPGNNFGKPTQAMSPLLSPLSRFVHGEALKLSRLELIQGLPVYVDVWPGSCLYVVLPGSSLLGRGPHLSGLKPVVPVREDGLVRVAKQNDCLGERLVVTNCKNMVRNSSDV